jgi:hypothetical protein
VTLVEEEEEDSSSSGSGSGSDSPVTAAAGAVRRSKFDDEEAEDSDVCLSPYDCSDKISRVSELTCYDHRS